jgi:glutamate racemase
MKRHHFHQPIGVFDSGIGGLTVANAISKCLPEEELIYFGDTLHVPYGDKSADAVRYYSLRIAKFLLEKECKMIVVACNTAATAAYRILLDFFDKEVLFVNVVDPLVKEVVRQGYHKVGVIATKGTTTTEVYPQRLRDLQPELEVVALATPLLAPMIEEGNIHDEVSKAVISNYLSHPRLEGIEALLLACTHYPIIKDDIEAFYQDRIKVYDSTDVVAAEVKKQLAANRLLNDHRRNPNLFYVSDYTTAFESTTRLFYGEEVQLELQQIWKDGM